MRYRSLGKTGLKVSAIGIGGIPIQRVNFEEAQKTLVSGFSKGITLIDTARAYTNSEEKIGSILRGYDRREEIIVATKSGSKTKDGMLADVEKSLVLLGIPVIHLYQLHGVNSEADLKQVMAPDGAYNALVEAKRNGKIKHIGITSHSCDILRKVIPQGFFETIQVPVNFIEQKPNLEIIQLAVDHGLGVLAMKPMGGGGGVFSNAVASLKWILLHPVSAAIPGMADVAEVEENVRAGDGDPACSSAELQQLEKDAATWSGKFCRRCDYCQPCPQEIIISLALRLDRFYSRFG
ncbi:MAG: hypothetical protein A2350_01030, partial [Candidatus Raymondbacteria bacterium RifOxyB12_full_50_8]